MYRRKLTAPHTTQVHDEVFGGLIASCKGDTTWLLAGAILFAVLGFFCILAGVQGQIAGAGSYLLIMLGIVFFAAAVFALLCMKDRIDFYEYGIFVITRKGIELALFCFSKLFSLPLVGLELLSGESVYKKRNSPHICAGFLFGRDCGRGIPLF